MVEENHASPVQATPRTSRVPHPVYWVIAASLATIAVNQVLSVGGRPDTGLAFAQPVSSGGARGVFAFTGQLTKNSYGVYLVDVDAMTIWAYEYLAQKNCLHLAAARSWRYDRYLENHNVCDLPPDVVEQMVEDQRKYRLQAAEQKLP